MFHMQKLEHILSALIIKPCMALHFISMVHLHGTLFSSICNSFFSCFTLPNHPHVYHVHYCILFFYHSGTSRAYHVNIRAMLYIYSHSCTLKLIRENNIFLIFYSSSPFFWYSIRASHRYWLCCWLLFFSPFLFSSLLHGFNQLWVVRFLCYPKGKSAIDDPFSLFFLHQLGSPRFEPVTQQLGDNYASWSAIMISLSLKNKLGFIDDSIPRLEDIDTNLLMPGLAIIIL